MRTRTNTLLAGVAALALFAGTGMALAQQSPQTQKGAVGVSEQGGMHAQSAKPAAGAAMEQHAQTGAKPGTDGAGSAALNKATQASEPSQAQKAMPDAKRQQEAKGPQAIKDQKSAEQINRGKMDARGAKKTAERRQERRPEQLGANAKPERSRSTAENEHNRRGRINTAQRNERNGSLKGLQGNASMPMQSKVTLTGKQKTTIRNTVIGARGAPKVGHVDFNVAVGTVVPRHRIDVVPVPETLVRIEPRWHGYLYFVYEDEVVIVNPHDMRIVAVVAV